VRAPSKDLHAPWDKKLVREMELLHGKAAKQVASGQTVMVGHHAPLAGSVLQVPEHWDKYERCCHSAGLSGHGSATPVTAASSER